MIKKRVNSSDKIMPDTHNKANKKNGRKLFSGRGEVINMP